MRKVVVFQKKTNTQQQNYHAGEILSIRIMMFIILMMICNNSETKLTYSF